MFTILVRIQRVKSRAFDIPNNDNRKDSSIDGGSVWEHDNKYLNTYYTLSFSTRFEWLSKLFTFRPDSRGINLSSEERITLPARKSIKWSKSRNNSTPPYDAALGNHRACEMRFLRLLRRHCWSYLPLSRFSVVWIKKIKIKQQSSWHENWHDTLYFIGCNIKKNLKMPTARE